MNNLSQQIAVTDWVIDRAIKSNCKEEIDFLEFFHALDLLLDIGDFSEDIISASKVLQDRLVDRGLLQDGAYA